MTNKIDKDAIGIEVSWSFGNGDAEAVTLPRAFVCNVLDNHGFNSKFYLEPLDADEALGNALRVVKGRSQTIVVQELRRPNKDTPRAIGVYQVQAKDGESGDNMVCGSRARVTNGRIECLEPEGSPGIAQCMTLGNELARIANSLLDNVINGHISMALVGMGWSAGWITRRRNSGGVYFLPATTAADRDMAERFVGVLKTLEQATNENRARQFIPQVMEVYAKPLTMELWSGSARDQYDHQLETLLGDLAKMHTDDKMRESTITKRAEECDRLIQLAEKHRIFLQEHVEVVTAELKRVRDEFTKKLDENAAEARKAFEDSDALTAKKAAKKNATATPTAAPAPTAAPKRKVTKPRPALETLTTEELFDVG